MEELKQLWEGFLETVNDADQRMKKFIEKGNKSAGTDVRKYMLRVKEYAHSIRQEISKAKNTAE